MQVHNHSMLEWSESLKKILFFEKAFLAKKFGDRKVAPGVCAHFSRLRMAIQPLDRILQTYFDDAKFGKKCNYMQIIALFEAKELE